MKYNTTLNNEYFRGRNHDHFLTSYPVFHMSNIFYITEMVGLFHFKYEMPILTSLRSAKKKSMSMAAIVYPWKEKSPS